MIDKLKAKGVENILVLVPPPVRGSSAQSLAEVVSVGVAVSFTSACVGGWGGGTLWLVTHTPLRPTHVTPCASTTNLTRPSNSRLCMLFWL
jgi:hypothetical protein